MSNLKPFLQRRPHKPWSGLVVGGIAGALVTALLTALAAGLLVGGRLFVHAQPSKLLAACGGTLLAAVLGVPGNLRAYATFLVPLFLVQAAITWGFFAWWAYPPYAATTKKKRRPKADVVPVQPPGNSEP